MSAQDAFVWLTDGTFVNYALDEAMKATEFELIGRLIRTTPVRMVIPPDDRTRISDVCEAILKDYRHIMATTSV
jgi:hypothetical protein